MEKPTARLERSLLLTRCLTQGASARSHEARAGGRFEIQGSIHSTRTTSHMPLVRPGTSKLTAPGNGHHTIAYTQGDSSTRREAVGLVMGQEELRPQHG